jgi:hypothetical protein
LERVPFDVGDVFMFTEDAGEGYANCKIRVQYAEQPHHTTNRFSYGIQTGKLEVDDTQLLHSVRIAGLTSSYTVQ